jgi:hypothetical protein
MSMPGMLAAIVGLGCGVGIAAVPLLQAETSTANPRITKTILRRFIFSAP